MILDGNKQEDQVREFDRLKAEHGIKPDKEKKKED